MNRSDALGEHYLRTVRDAFASEKQLAEGALEQLRDDELDWTPDPESNSVAVLIKHLHGNMRSRWRDFLTSDGEKPDRQRNEEFVAEQPGRKLLMARWEEGWQTLFDALDKLTPADLMKSVTIRGKEHSVIEAIERQLWHYATHVGQILYIGKHLRGASWKSLSIPKTPSERDTPETS